MEVLETRKTSHIEFRINHGDGFIGPEGYSKYWQRYSMHDKKQITYDEIYGIEQCIEHLHEIRNTKGEYSDYWKNETLEPVRIITFKITETLKLE